jgi:hypothetical protein
MVADGDETLGRAAEGFTDRENSVNITYLS